MCNPETLESNIPGIYLGGRDRCRLAHQRDLHRKRTLSWEADRGVDGLQHATAGHCARRGCRSEFDRLSIQIRLRGWFLAHGLVAAIDSLADARRPGAAGGAFHWPVRSTSSAAADPPDQSDVRSIGCSTSRQPSPMSPLRRSGSSGQVGLIWRAAQSSTHRLWSQRRLSAPSGDVLFFRSGKKNRLNLSAAERAQISGPARCVKGFPKRQAVDGRQSGLSIPETISAAMPW